MELKSAWPLADKSETTFSTADVRMGQNCVSDVQENAWATPLELYDREEGGTSCRFLPGTPSSWAAWVFSKEYTRGNAWRHPASLRHHNRSISHAQHETWGSGQKMGCLAPAEYPQLTCTFAWITASYYVSCPWEDRYQSLDYEFQTPINNCVITPHVIMAMLFHTIPR